MATDPSTTKKITKRVDYQALKDKELIKKVAKLREELDTLKRNTLIGDVQNVHAYSYKRRDLARALTAMNNQPVKKEEA